MDKGFTLPQIIALIFLVLIGILVIFIVKNMVPKKEMPYINYQHDDNPEIILNGSFLEYVPLNSQYVEKGALAVNKSGINISNYIVKTIYLDNHVLTTINTKTPNVYKIVYTVTDPNDATLTEAVSRVVVVTKKELMNGALLYFTI